MVRGEDLRPWYQISSGQYLIFTRRGIEIDKYPAIKRYLEPFRSKLEPKQASWNDKLQGEWSGRKAGTYAWYEIQDQIAFYQEFEKSKIFAPDIAKLPRFSWSEIGKYINDTCTVIVPTNKAILSNLNSRALWFAFSQIAIPLRLRAGLWQYRGKLQFIRRLPIPALTPDQESSLAAIAEEITALANMRYRMHENTRRTMQGEFGGKPIESRVTLYRWWELADERALNAEIQRQFGQEIPLRKRAEWRDFMDNQNMDHQKLTAMIIVLETRLNDIVYDAFGLDAAERDLIERTTKYPYGEV